MKKMTIELAADKKGGNAVKRTAVRGIIKRDGHYLAIYSKYGDYKFPGGGQQAGETMLETLAREVKEETGYEVKAGTAREYMEVFERCESGSSDLMEMISYYYFCEVSESAGCRKLDDYEAEYGYEAVWLPLEELIKRNEAVKDITAVPWVIRETKVMEQLAADMCFS